MKQEELLGLNICPFDHAVMGDSMEGNETEKEEKAHFVLVLRYLALLMQQCRITFPIPKMADCLKRNECKNNYCCTGFTAKRVKMLEDMQKEILINSGWSYGKGRLEQEKVSGLMLYSLKEVKLQDFQKAVLQIPHILALGREGFQEAAVTVCWNERIGRYFDYVVSNPEEAEKCFHKGTALIDSILRKLADPYAAGYSFRSYEGGRYVMGYFEGRNDEGVISIKDMDYNFFVQAIILHLLLDCAEELFRLPKWEVGYET